METKYVSQMKKRIVYSKITGKTWKALSREFVEQTEKDTTPNSFQRNLLTFPTLYR